MENKSMINIETVEHDKSMINNEPNIEIVPSFDELHKHEAVPGLYLGIESNESTGEGCDKGMMAMLLAAKDHMSQLWLRCSAMQAMPRCHVVPSSVVSWSF